MNHTNVVDVKAWIDTRPVSRFQWNVLLLCFIIIMLDGYDAAVMGFVAPALIEDWGISRAEMGPILGAAMFGVAIGALVAGPLSDRYGRKRILLWSVALFALFSLAGAVAQSPTQLALMRFLTGLGLGAVMPNCVTLVAEYMPERRKGVMITLMYSGFNVGSGLGGFIPAGLLSHYSWHSALVFGGVLPLVVLPFLIVITLFPFGVGAAPQLLAQIAPGVVWVAALLAALLVMDRLFRDDWQDGSLEQLMLLPTPLVAVVLVKVVAHWMMSGLPLLIVSPLAALLLGMSLHDAGVLALTLLLGTPTLSFLGAVGVGLTVGLKRGGVLLSLLVLPLAVPLLIFATAACQAAAAGLPVSGYLAMLAAFLTASATLCPFATAAALRLTVR